MLVVNFTAMNPVEKEYYSSHVKLPFIHHEGQQRLLQSKVLVIGAGGLGCPCLLALTGAGVGHIGIADFDYVAVSNLHRQTLYTVADAGKKKVELAKERLVQYNPFISIAAHDLYVQQKNVLELLMSYDIVVDCTDNFVARYLINDACVYLNKPLVYGAVHKTEGQVTVFNFNGSATLRCLFPEDGTDTTQSCADIGAYTITTGMVGLLMANEVIKMIAGSDEVLSDILLTIDACTGTMLKFTYRRNEQRTAVSRQRFEKENQSA